MISAYQKFRKVWCDDKGCYFAVFAFQGKIAG